MALTDTNQVVDTQYFYDPFGGTTNTGTGNKNSYQFTGRENDATGLYHYRARYYHPALGRFISEDPLGMMSGDANVYVYGRNSSLNLIDPSGMDPNGLENQLINLPFNLIVGVFQAAGYLGAVVGVGEVADGVMGAILGDIGAEIAPAELGAMAEEQNTPDLLYHYTTADEGSFANGLWEGTSVTDTLYTDPVQASQELGIPVPDKVIPIQNTGQFVPNTPPIVQETPRYLGGGTDFINPQPVPPSQILPAQPIGVK